MQYEIKGTPFPAVICKLNDGEAVKCEKGGMSWMSPNMRMETNTGGGIGKMFSRAFSGESMFQNLYIAEGGVGEIAFASSFPGHILPIQISPNRTIVAQKSAFLASEISVEMSIFFQKKIGSGFFGGEGFIMQKFSGMGFVFLEIDGSIIEYDLGVGQSIRIDTGYLAAMDDTCSIEIESVKGVGNIIFGGEGFFNTRICGPGHVWLQTMPVYGVARTIQPYITLNK